MKQNTLIRQFSKLSSVLIGFMAISACATALITLPSYIKGKQAVKNQDAAPAITIKIQQFATGLQAPTALAFPDNNRVLVTEQTGKIRLIKNGKLSETPFLDVTSKMVKINTGYDERGLMGIALHPKFSTNKKFYVYYSAPKSAEKSDNKSVVAEFKVSASNPDQADPSSERILLTFDQPESNHNGGDIHFGADGYLYIASGDGGGGGDRHGTIGNGQNMNTLLGKILRIDVNSATTYGIPKDNPFVGKADVKPEIWAYGLRNPYRFSFDKASKKLFAGEVGQDKWEEVDIIEKGGNYGWRISEGFHCFDPKNDCNMTGITLPIAEYSHSDGGICIIGGYVYNGSQLPALKSKYLFADWTGPVYYLQKAASGKWARGKVTVQNFPENSKITGFGEDLSGELYMMTNPDIGPGNTKCSIYKIVKN